MRLHSLKVSGLRSVDEAELDACGNFNVLIGKNNSGKSNMLAGIDHFFRFLKDGSVATVNPSLSRPVDFFEKDQSRAISVTAQLELKGEILNSLVSDIRAEFPQVSNALPDPSQDSRLELQIVFTSKTSSPLAYIRKIKWIYAEEKLDPTPILDVPIEAASEIALRQDELRSSTRQAAQVLKYLNQFEEDDWERVRARRSGVASLTLSPRIRQNLGASANDIVMAVHRSKSFDEARNSIEALALSLRARSEELDEATLKTNLNAFAGTTDSVPEYVSNLLEILKDCSILHLADQRRPIGAEEADKILSLKVSRGGDKMLRNIQSVVSSLLGVKIDAFSVEGSSSRSVDLYTSNQSPSAELDVDDFLVQVNGSGIREALRLVLDLEFENPDILLVEEPEVHLHPALEVAMMRHLKNVSAKTQVFLTTHSTNFLDTGDMNNVYMVRGDGSTRTTHLDVADAESEIPRELGIRLSSVFMFDRLIFVEGISDELVIRAIAETLEVNLSQANVGFVVMGGARNFTHFAARSTLSLLAKRNVYSTFVLDRDEKSQGQFERLAQQLGGDADLHVLKRRELENYFIQPRLLSRFVNARRSLTLDSVKDEEIATALNEEADNLRTLSIAKRLAAYTCTIHRADRQEILNKWESVGIEQACEEALSEVEKSISNAREALSSTLTEMQSDLDSKWSSSKLEIVPGHELIDNVLRRYGLRYKKDRDADSLARLIEAEEIPIELKQMIYKATGSSGSKVI